MNNFNEQTTGDLAVAKATETSFRRRAIFIAAMMVASLFVVVAVSGASKATTGPFKRSLRDRHHAFLFSRSLKGRSDDPDLKQKCPELTDPCMNDHNYAECLEIIIDSRCVSMYIMESCPMQFGCE
jgi:hypothetical protein